MNVYKKLGALALVFALAFALCAPAFATATATRSTSTLNASGEQGAFETKDRIAAQTEKKLTLDKELTVYNKSGITINAPTISYTYTIRTATAEEVADKAVTDSADKHNSGSAVTMPVKAGVGTPTIANGGVVSWATTDTVTAADDGAANYKPIEINFSNVVFSSGAGVYRYVITEAITNADTYAMSGVTETTAPTASAHTRYIDVYVKPADSGYNDGSTADEWTIYGFTCFYNNVSFTDATKTTAAVKTTGFVAGTTDGTDNTAFKADSYYTFNVTVSKTVENDAYAAANHPFPFTVIFTNDSVTKNIDISSVSTATETGFTDPSAGVLSNTSGILWLKSGQSVKYIGIPNGTTVDVFETNNYTGVTYKVDTTVDSAATPTQSDSAVTAGTAPSSAVAQTSKADNESTKVTVTTTANQDDDTEHSVAIVNTLLNISPTGVTLRYAPYLLTLGAGIVALPLTKSYRKREDF